MRRNYFRNSRLFPVRRDDATDGRRSRKAQLFCPGICFLFYFKQTRLGMMSYRLIDPQTLHGNVHQVDHVPNGPINSAAITTMFPLLLCGGKPLVAVTRERRYGPSRLRVNDDDDDARNDMIHSMTRMSNKLEVNGKPVGESLRRHARVYVYTHAQTDGQVENITPHPRSREGGKVIKISNLLGIVSLPRSLSSYSRTHLIF